MKKLSLLRLKKKHKAKIIEVSGGPVLQNRLMSMGIHPGREVTKLSHFVLRGPVTIRVGRSVVALGHGMAGKVIVGVDD